MTSASSNTSKTPINDEEFPTTSIRVLLVDADSESLLLLKNLMTEFSYRVTSYENGEEAIDFLRKNKHVIDLVIWEFHMPEINGLEALKTIGKEMDLPLAIMSSDYKKETVTKSIKNGACDFLVKPLSREVTAVLWRHVLSKSGFDKTVASSSEENDIRNRSNEEGSITAGYSGDCNTSDGKGNKRKERRMHWTPKLHQMFENAVANLGGLDNAVPKQILNYMQEEMNVKELTRNKVASHLQKYRLNASKSSSVPQETEEDLGFGVNTAPSLNVGFNNLNFTNNIAGTSSSYQRMNNNNNNPFMTINVPRSNYPYIDQFHHQLQQQYSPPPPLRSPSDQLTYDPLPFGPEFYNNSCFGNFK